MWTFKKPLEESAALLVSIGWWRMSRLKENILKHPQAMHCAISLNIHYVLQFNDKNSMETVCLSTLHTGFTPNPSTLDENVNHMMCIYIYIVDIIDIIIMYVIYIYICRRYVFRNIYIHTNKFRNIYICTLRYVFILYLSI